MLYVCHFICAGIQYTNVVVGLLCQRLLAAYLSYFGGFVPTFVGVVFMCCYRAEIQHDAMD